MQYDDTHYVGSTGHSLNPNCDFDCDDYRQGTLSLYAAFNTTKTRKVLLKTAHDVTSAGSMHS
jgi:hypothetical protein